MTSITTKAVALLPAPKAPFLALFALLLVADVLFWGMTLGLNVPLFLLLLACGTHLHFGRRARWKTCVIAWAILLVSLVPSVEVAQTVSTLLALGGFCVFVGLLTGPDPRAQVWATMRFPIQMVSCISTDSKSMLRRAPKPHRRELLASLTDWIVPLGLGLVFLGLMMPANPVIDRWIWDLFQERSLPNIDVARLVFWVGVALFVWPCLRLVTFRDQLLRPAPNLRPLGQVWYLSERSVVRALILFNLIFATQTLSDIGILWSDVVLPDGVTYAKYAHRGAYPLLFAALLAGGFALLAQPFIEDRPLLRILLLVWVGQTAVLMASAMLRLDLYIDAYGLTRLRFFAFIGMALIGGGLVLMMWQILRAFRQSWLMIRLAELSLITVYVCSLINVDGFVVRHNVNHYDTLLPGDYVCSLGKGADIEIAQYEDANNVSLCGDDRGMSIDWYRSSDWREWGYRNARLRNKLAEI